MNISDWNFEYVSNISPKIDSQGNPIEFSPQKKYDNKKNLRLHKYGEGPFCKFNIEKKYSQKIGVYVMLIDNNIHYVGECEDFRKRVYDYGNISPRNCFDGGRRTNCRVNSDILKMIKNGKEIELYFLETKDRFEIEYQLIKKFKPIWNKTIGKPSKIN